MYKEDCKWCISSKNQLCHWFSEITAWCFWKSYLNKKVVILLIWHCSLTFLGCLSPVTPFHNHSHPFLLFSMASMWLSWCFHLQYFFRSRKKTCKPLPSCRFRCILLCMWNLKQWRNLSLARGQPMLELEYVLHNHSSFFPLFLVWNMFNMVEAFCRCIKHAMVFQSFPKAIGFADYPKSSKTI